MEKVLDKIIILICCSIYLVLNKFDFYTPVLIIGVIFVSAMTTAISKDAFNIASFLLYCILTYFIPDLIYFIPLVSYDLFCENYKQVSILGLFAYIINFSILTPITFFWLIVISFLSYLAKIRTYALYKAKKNYISLRDESIENDMRLNIKNKELLEKQEYIIANATLNERNRIAREIHDSVGHLLSSSILQIGALLAISKDETTKNSLIDIKDTLTKGMDSIRSSIHNIHEDSIDLKAKLEETFDDFSFCEVNFVYNINNDFSIKEKYTILFIVKESLANISKHSNATLVKITLTELPALYQIIIKDNGTKFNSNRSQQSNHSSSGIGLLSMTERIASLDGNINFSFDNGYRIFISIPKNI